MDFDSMLDEGWPAYERHDLEGWILRWAGGVTKRANSVLAWSTPADPIALVERAEKFYAERGQACTFSIGARAMPGIDGLLAERGYRLIDESSIMLAPPGPAREAEHRVRVEDAPWDGWMESWWSVDGRHGEGYGTARRIACGVPATYAAVEDENGVALAVGRAVRQGDVLGIFCMATLPRARRRGLARSLLRALVGDGGTYLVVTKHNQAAKAFYAGEGFAEVGEYHYRTQ